MPEKPLATPALAVAFGFQPAGAPMPSQLDITLKACFVSSHGEARALVAGAGGEAVYRVGDRLPEGGVLRRIENRAITLWFNGREQVVALSGSKSTIFQPSDSRVPASSRGTTTSRLLREVQ
ncbi:type II secretion system protein N [Pseudomonas sp. Teo4]|uniref:type II secretion system protein N n=1 Tax=Pseudomonas sp. Teo4 TaxID=3064528 RepID=UPI002ACB0863|nr:type II secretion system protein N [Pseudomonas sp. Teo4]